VDREISFIASYPCPHCRATLEERPGGAGSWRRCPKCGRASRPPVHAVTARRAPAPATPQDRIDLVIGPEIELPAMTPVAVAAPPGPGRDPGPSPTSIRAPAQPFDHLTAPAPSTLRVVYASALFVSVTMLLFSFLDRSVLGTSLFGASAVLFFVILAMPARPGR